MKSSPDVALLPMTRQTVPARLADLGFSIDVPEGFVSPELPQEDVDFNDATKSAPLAIFSSPVALALIAVAARPAYADGSLYEWMHMLTRHFGLRVTGLMPSLVGGRSSAHPPHPALLLEAEQVQEETRVIFRMVALEDGQRLVTAQCMCAAELWPSFGPSLERALLSLELAAPTGPTAPLLPGNPAGMPVMASGPLGCWPRCGGGYNE